VLYRLTGPNRLITKALFDTLLGANAIKAHPDRAADIIRAFTEADRDSIRRTVRFMHRWRPLTDTLPKVNAQVAALTGAGHLGLLVDADLIARTVTEFWRTLR
jgi:hypothetical protein